MRPWGDVRVANLCSSLCEGLGHKEGNGDDSDDELWDIGTKGQDVEATHSIG